ncbi:hypothetical protein PSACC_02983 [Paramicrosporidium saccamoebae]|uniref:Uncharacterized protein n=1 Tax=Paramicrosporidium saccamoebae TaxID=1246581 RepID=A0A2H9THD8_9FUNG|nr:hypothetical protein PSACC_02983 [Paramicrosporidium saccamoebae]
MRFVSHQLWRALYETRMWISHRTSRGLRIGSLTVAAGITWFVAYDYFTDKVNRSSVLVRQTLYNMRHNPDVLRMLGNDLRVTSRVEGYQSQNQAHADITFKAIGSENIPASVHVIADKLGWDWQTRKLKVIIDNREVVLLEDQRDVQ